MQDGTREPKVHDEGESGDNHGLLVSTETPAVDAAYRMQTVGQGLFPDCFFVEPDLDSIFVTELLEISLNACFVVSNVF